MQAKMKMVSKKFLAVFAAVLILFTAVFQPPAKAIAVVDDVAVVVAVFVAACGLTWIVTNQASDGFQDTVKSLITQYAQTLGDSYATWCAKVSYTLTFGTFNMPKATVELLKPFVQWLVSNFGVQANSEPVTVYRNGLEVTDYGNYYDIGGIRAVKSWGMTGAQELSYVQQTLTYIPFVEGGLIYPFPWDSTCYLVMHHDTTYYLSLYFPNGTHQTISNIALSNGNVPFYHALTYINSPDYSNVLLEILSKTPTDTWTGSSYPSGSWTLIYQSVISALTSTVPVEAVQVEAGTISYPDTTTMADDETLDVATGIGQTGSLTDDETIQKIIDGILAGTLAVPTTETKTAEGTAEAVTDVNDLGLDTLGTIFITKFPFSIPWDVAAAISLLNAEPEAPNWTIDLMMPLKDRVDFQGDTSIHIDMSNYPLVGQISRWTCIIGFCFALALGTKRLIWGA